MEFKLVSAYQPTGDQPAAIEQLSQGVLSGLPHQTLLGVTGSGKTFTIANLIERVQKPTLILSHNKTLAAQLYAEFKDFFPHNAVEYYVSYYDYYQPEAYLPVTGTYIEKDLQINEEIEKLRLAATSSLLSGRKDIIVVSSVSCIYGIGNPEEFDKSAIAIKVGMVIGRDVLLRQLVDALYSRSEISFERGNFRVKGDTIDIFLAYADTGYRIILWDDEIESIQQIDTVSGATLERVSDLIIYPANLFMTSKERLWDAIREIQDDMVAEAEVFARSGRPLEAKRLQERVEYDLEMIKELGYCSGIENYSRYFDGRSKGSRPFCLLDYFPDGYLVVIDESHVTIPQVRGMYGGDRSRKINLVDNGFRLQAAVDNRPLTFDEFQEIIPQAVYVSATPADYELEMSEGVVVEQVIRPTGLLDPVIEVRPTVNQIDDLVAEIHKRAEIDERILVTTLTKRMAEELARYFDKIGIRSAYIHSDVDTMERVEILSQLRQGIFDVLIGVNLLREGLDLPEVSLVAILDADKEGFLRNERSLTQTAGRAARNVNGMVIMYADKITASMQKTITETNRRRTKQHEYNVEHGQTPQPLRKKLSGGLGESREERSYTLPEQLAMAMDPVIQYMDRHAVDKAIEKNTAAMMEASKKMDYLEAARLRDEIYALERIRDQKNK